MAHGALTPIIGLRLLALAAGLRHNAEIGQPGLCFSAYGHKFGINHLALDPQLRPVGNNQSIRPGMAGSANAPACILGPCPRTWTSYARSSRPGSAATSG